MLKLVLLPFQVALVCLIAWMVDLWVHAPAEVPWYLKGLMLCLLALPTIMIGLVTWEEYHG